MFHLPGRLSHPVKKISDFSEASDPCKSSIVLALMMSKRALLLSLWSDKSVRSVDSVYWPSRG